MIQEIVITQACCDGPGCTTKHRGHKGTRVSHTQARILAEAQGWHFPLKSGTKQRWSFCRRCYKKWVDKNRGIL